MTGPLDTPFTFTEVSDTLLPSWRKRATVKVPLTATPAPSSSSSSIVPAAQSNQEAFIYQITRAAGHLAISTSVNNVHLYDPQTLQLATTLSHHSDRITDMEPAGASLLYTSSEDGAVRCWDLREPAAPARTFHAGTKNGMSSLDRLLSLSLNSMGTVLAAGAKQNSNAEAPIYFWDVRAATAELACFLDTHCDDVYQVRFHPAAPSMLLTGSEDGQMALLDVANFEEDEAPVHCFNTEISIDKIGFFGNAYEYAYCVNTVPTFSLWSVVEGDPICKFGDTRTVADKNPSMPLDYVIDCKYDAASGRLYAMTGSYCGHISIFHVGLGSLDHCQTLEPAHDGVVRCVYWESEASVLVSGGEDGRLNIWSVH